MCVPPRTQFNRTQKNKFSPHFCIKYNLAMDDIKTTILTSESHDNCLNDNAYFNVHKSKCDITLSLNTIGENKKEIGRSIINFHFPFLFRFVEIQIFNAVSSNLQVIKHRLQHV